MAVENRQFQLMLKPAVERLQKYSAAELCEKAKIRFLEDESVFVIDSLGEEIKVHYPDYEIVQELDMWRHLTLLQYMDTADGSALSGNWIGLSQMPGGLSRGLGFDRDIAGILTQSFATVNAEQFRAACEAIGGEIVKGKGDVTAKIFYAPMFPVLINFWEGDDEFPVSGKVLVDANADHYLTVEAAGGACAAVMLELAKHV